MKSKIINIFWGAILIILSGLLAAEALGTISFGSITDWGWATAFGIASAAFFITYFLSGVKQWGWLFPALLCAAIGWGNLHTGRALDPFNPDWSVVAALAIPFYAGFILNRKRWGLLIPAYSLTAAAFMTVSSELITADRTFLFALFVAAGPLFLFALPFFGLYFWSEKNWWALIPAGGLTSIGLVTLLSILIPDKQNALTGVYSAILFLGFAVTMGVLWLRRATQPTGWAKYPAVIFLALAVAVFILGKGWNDLSQEFKAIIFLAGSVAFLLAYFLHGMRKWGWLFPACACAAIALTIWMEIKGMGDSITGAPLFAAAALPFFVGFAVDRKRRGLLIPASLLTFVTFFMLIIDSVPDEWDGVLFMFLFALPFLVVYFWSKHAWWALLTAGVFTTIGLVALLDNLVPHAEYPTLQGHLSFGMYTWVMLLGLAATFGAVWLSHKTEPTDWAKYPAAGLLVVAVLAFLLREQFQEVWLAVVTLVIGVMLLLATLDKKKLSADQPTFAGKA